MSTERRPQAPFLSGILLALSWSNYGLSGSRVASDGMFSKPFQYFEPWGTVLPERV